MSEYLFVCGTLRPQLASGDLRELIGGLRIVGKGVIPGRLYDMGEYPGAIFDPHGESKVVGDVLELPGDQQIISRLDVYEGIDQQDLDSSLFVRLRREVTIDDGRKLDCWVYGYNRQASSKTQILSGDYISWLQKQK